MRQWTTPINTFDVDIDLTECEVIFITYKQGEEIILEKTIEDMTVTADQITVQLTQSETGMFDTSSPLRMQIRAKFPPSVEYPNGLAVESNIMETCVGEAFKTGEI